MDQGVGRSRTDRTSRRTLVERSGSPTDAAPPPAALASFRRLSRRSRIFVAAAAVVVIAIAAVVAYVVSARTSPSSRQVIAPSATAEPPFRLTQYVTDHAGALTDSGRANVESAIDKLYSDRRIRLWVVYVGSFGAQLAVTWTESTVRTSDFGDRDALLAVATVESIWVHGAGEYRRHHLEPSRESAAQRDRTRAAPQRFQRRGRRGCQRPRQHGGLTRLHGV